MTILNPAESVAVGSSPDRELAYAVSGAPNGYPVFLLHGTPGSKSGPKPRGIVLYRLGVKLITYDRPGYGDSPRMEGRVVRDAATDVEWIAERLGVRGSFAVVGRSGGGPHALAVAAELPDRVSCVAALVSLAPSEADNWYEGMGPHNADEYGRADDAEALREHLTRRASEAQDDPQRIIEELVPELSRTDHRVVGDVVFRRLLIETYREGLRQGPAGWIDDVLAFRQPWGIDLSAITAPVLLWHGKQDRFSPFQHTLWLRDRLTGAPDRVELRTPLESGHFAAVEALPDILSWVVEQKETPTPAWSRTPPVDSAIVRGG